MTPEEIAARDDGRGSRVAVDDAAAEQVDSRSRWGGAGHV